MGCSIIGKCRDKETGKLTSKDSQLHKDLLGLTSFNRRFSRKKANNVLHLSQSRTFQKEFSEDLVWDSQDNDAEPWVASMYEIVGDQFKPLTLKNIRDSLAKKFKEGEYDYVTGLQKVIEFNKIGAGAHTFMATLQRQANGKVFFTITYNSESAQNDLIDLVTDRVFAESILERLQNSGVTAIEGLQSIYSTEGEIPIINGYKGLIQLRGGLNNLEDFQKETGHFIVESLGEDHPLVQRLYRSASNPAVARELLGAEEYATYRTSVEEGKRKKEYAGHIVGKYFEVYKNQRNSNFFKRVWSRFSNMIDRMVNLVKSKLPYVAQDYREYNEQLYNAKTAAWKMVKSFMGSNFQGTTLNAMKSPITLESKKTSKLTEGLKKIVQEMHKLYYNKKDEGFKKSKQYNDEFHKMYDAFTKYYETEQTTSDINLLQVEEKEVTKAARNAMFFIASEMEKGVAEMNRALYGTKPDGSFYDITELGQIVQKYRYLQRAAELFLQTFKDLETKNALYKDSPGYRNIKTSVDKLRTLLNAMNSQNEASFQSLLDDLMKTVALKLLVKINGSSFITMEQHVSMQKGKIVRHKTELIDIEDVLENSKDAPNMLYVRLIDAMADNPSIINQMVANIIEEQKYRANQNSIEMRQRLLSIYRQMKQDGINSTSIFFEKDSSGNYTGNLISERNWGEWQKDLNEAVEKFDEEFYEDNKDTRGWSSIKDMHQDFLYARRLKAFKNEWHKSHSVLIPVLDAKGEVQLQEDGTIYKMRAPALSTEGSYAKTYEHPQYNALSAIEKQYLNKYVNIKKELDDLLPPGAVSIQGIRAPQFKKAIHGASIMSSREAYISQTMGRDPSITTYGGENSAIEEESLFDEDIIFDEEHLEKLSSIEKVPLFGIKKLNNMNQLSTDLTQSLLAYAHMAYSNNCLNSVIGSVLSLRDQIYKVDNIEDMSRKGDQPASYKRLNDYLRQQVFNDYTSGQKKVTKGLRKATTFLTMLGSTAYLGFNLSSSVVNALTGFWEIYKEAGGDEFTYTNLMAAMGTYLRYWGIGVADNVINIMTPNYGSNIKSDSKMHLFFRKYDVMNDLDRELANEYAESTGYGMLQGKNLISIAMYPFKFFELWMNGIPALAASMHQKLRNKNTGEFVSIWNAYEVVNGELKLKGGDNVWEIEDFNHSTQRDLLATKELNEKLSDKEKEALYVINPEAEKNPNIQDFYLKYYVKHNVNGTTVYQSTVKDGDNLIHKYYVKNSLGNLIEAEEWFNAEDYNYMIDNIEPVVSTDQNNTTSSTAVINENTGEYEFAHKNKYIPFDEQAQNTWRMRMRGINNRLHGVYNRMDAGAMCKFALAAPLLSFKKYAIGLIDARFARGRYDLRTKMWRQGRYTTLLNLLLDECTNNGGKHFRNTNLLPNREGIKREGIMRSLGYPLLKATLGVTKTSLILAGSIIGLNKISRLAKDGHPNWQKWLGNSRWANFLSRYLENRCYSFNQINNLSKIVKDTLVPLFIYNILMATLLAPPPDDDKNKYEAWLPGVSQFLLDTLLWESSLFRKIGWTTTNDDEKLMTEQHFKEMAKNNGGGIPFDVKGILYFLCYRTYKEQIAYNVNPFLAFKGPIQEWLSLTDNTIPSFNALLDITEALWYTWFGPDVVEDRGPFKGFKRGKRKLHRLGITKTMGNYAFPYWTENQQESQSDKPIFTEKVAKQQEEALAKEQKRKEKEEKEANKNEYEGKRKRRRNLKEV